MRGTLLAIEHMRKDKGGSGGIIIKRLICGRYVMLYNAFVCPTEQFNPCFFFRSNIR